MPFFQRCDPVNDERVPLPSSSDNQEGEVRVPNESPPSPMEEIGQKNSNGFAPVPIVAPPPTVNQAQMILHKQRTLRGLSAVVACGVIVIVVVAVLYFLSKHHSGEPDVKWENCVTPFGAAIGTAFGTASYSNCNDSYSSDESNYISVLTATGDSISVYTGMKWQCVEFARRFLIERRGVYFASVDGATDIFALMYVSSVVNSSKYSFSSRRNGGTKISPAVGDLIIYPVQNGMPFGHVAVVVEVDVGEGSLHIAEQNWDSKKWVYNGYSRILKFHVSPSRLVSITDSPYSVVGWKQLGNKM